MPARSLSATTLVGILLGCGSSPPDVKRKKRSPFGTEHLELFASEWTPERALSGAALTWPSWCGPHPSRRAFDGHDPLDTERGGMPGSNAMARQGELNAHKERESDGFI